LTNAKIEYKINEEETRQVNELDRLISSGCTGNSIVAGRVALPSEPMKKPWPTIFEHGLHREKGHKLNILGD
jgi:hypothetical protein